MRLRRHATLIASLAAALVVCAPSADARPPFRPVKKKVVVPAPVAAESALNASGATPSSTAAASAVRPFSVHWCVTGRYENQIDLSPYPFVQRDVVIFYQQRFGRYPRYYQKQFEENGGLPQRVNLPAHLAKVRTDVAAAIPDPNWSGFAVIDYEDWNLHWSILHEFYKDKSRAWVRQRSPGFSADQVEAQAKLEWEAGAKAFYLETINLCKSLRPHAKWGFYGTPWYHGNDQRLTPWLMEACTAMYPSIYAFDYGVTAGAPSRGQANVSKFREFVETSVVNARALGGPDKPVLCFVWMRYLDRHQEYQYKTLNPNDLRIMIDGPREHGADGIIVWDDMNDVAGAAECRQYFREFMGPEIERSVNAAGAAAAAPPAPPVRKTIVPLKRVVAPRR